LISKLINKTAKSNRTASSSKTSTRITLTARVSTFWPRNGARQLFQGARPLVSSNNREIVTALREIAEGKVRPGLPYITETAMRHSQPHHKTELSIMYLSSEWEPLAVGVPVIKTVVSTIWYRDEARR